MQLSYHIAAAATTRTRASVPIHGERDFDKESDDCRIGGSEVVRDVDRDHAASWIVQDCPSTYSYTDPQCSTEMK